MGSTVPPRGIRMTGRSNILQGSELVAEDIQGSGLVADV